MAQSTFQKLKNQWANETRDEEKLAAHLVSRPALLLSDSVISLYFFQFLLIFLGPQFLTLASVPHMVPDF